MGGGLGEGSGEAELSEAEGVLDGLRISAVVYAEEKVCVYVRACVRVRARMCACMYAYVFFLPCLVLLRFACLAFCACAFSLLEAAFLFLIV